EKRRGLAPAIAEFSLEGERLVCRRGRLIGLVSQHALMRARMEQLSSLRGCHRLGESKRPRILRRALPVGANGRRPASCLRREAENTCAVVGGLGMMREPCVVVRIMQRPQSE